MQLLLRCDRLDPCSSCKHRGLPACTYPEPKRLGSDRVAKEKKQTNASNLTDRIGHLERLITSFVENSNSPTVLSQIETDLSKDLGIEGSQLEKIEPTKSFGHISLQGSKATYVDDTHWSAILDEVSRPSSVLVLLID
ncbi:fungal-specific transcription factor [Penicillium taxi]|uniref:fungal-specific transcription factor n=1 Tax=Penicillium taxi TaxID=168475 RepID=UPI00254527B2|nr:fungal-specific transcription factor [Penicillium taxi]KAJ5895070.1 fungal-specific transcription factor [Penicillium taxi]